MILEPAPLDRLLLLALCPDILDDGVDLAVHEQDEMLRLFFYRHGEELGPALAMYLRSGKELWATFRRILEWRFGGLDRAAKLLDFASGYGRVTRFLVRDLAPERVWVSDIEAEAMRFQSDRFGVHALLSAPRADTFRCEERFDCILVSSLFTHLPEEGFQAWLGRLAGLLQPGGVLAFSSHDMALLPAGPGAPADFEFRPVSESRWLDTAQYGTTWVREGFVRAAVARAVPGASALRIPKGLGSYQDLYIVVPEPGQDFSGLEVRLSPTAFVESCAIDPPDRIELSGWLIDRVTGGCPREVRAVVGGRIFARCEELSRRDDVTGFFPGEGAEGWGWRLRFALGPGRPDLSAGLRIEATDALGRETLVQESSIEGALLRSARFDLHLSRSALSRREAELSRELAACRERVAEVERRGQAEAARLEAVIAAMRASRFWKLRDRWFALKHLLRLTTEHRDR